MATHNLLRLSEMPFGQHHRPAQWWVMKSVVDQFPLSNASSSLAARHRLLPSSGPSDNSTNERLWRKLPSSGLHWGVVPNHMLLGARALWIWGLKGCDWLVGIMTYIILKLILLIYFGGHSLNSRYVKLQTVWTHQIKCMRYSTLSDLIC